MIDKWSKSESQQKKIKIVEETNVIIFTFPKMLFKLIWMKYEIVVFRRWDWLWVVLWFRLKEWNVKLCYSKKWDQYCRKMSLNCILNCILNSIYSIPPNLYFVSFSPVSDVSMQAQLVTMQAQLVTMQAQLVTMCTHFMVLCAPSRCTGFHLACTI